MGDSRRSVDAVGGFSGGPLANTTTTASTSTTTRASYEAPAAAQSQSQSHSTTAASHKRTNSQMQRFTEKPSDDPLSSSHNGSSQFPLLAADPPSQAPLLPPPPPSGPPEKVTWMSLPHKPQLLILALCRLSEPLSNTCLLSYLYYLIRSLQPPSATPSQNARQAGLLVSLFAIAQFATSMAWGRVADTWGRKPVIVVGLAMSIASNLGFGFGRSIPAVMFWRVVAGVGNGNIGVMRTMTAEIVREKKYQSRAFLLLPLVFNSGVIAGLALGGWLADPVANMPGLFGARGWLNVGGGTEGVEWLRRFPYALPTMFNAALLGVSLVLAVCGLRETLAGKEDEPDRGLAVGRSVVRFVQRSVFRRRSRRGRGYAALGRADDDTDGDTDSDVEEKKSRPPPPPAFKRAPPPPFRSIWTRNVLATLLSFALLPIHNSAFMQIFPQFLSTPRLPNQSPTLVHFNGGLGLPSSIIGTWLAVFGVSGILLQLLIYPRMQARIGTLNSYRLALVVFPGVYILAPYLALLPAHGLARWAAIALILFLQVMARTFAIPSSVILLTNVAPSPATLGTIHGAGNMLASLTRAIGPAAGGWVNGWGMERGVVGVVWWGYLAVIAVGAAGWSWHLQEGRGIGSEAHARGAVAAAAARGKGGEVEMVLVKEAGEVVPGRPRKNS